MKAFELTQLLDQHRHSGEAWSEFLRVSALMPPAWQVGLSIALTLATTFALNWVAARIYRVGILMYGKRPTLSEILKWIGKP